MINPGIIQNEVARHKTKASLMLSLENMMVSGEVLDWKEQGGLLLVTINGQTQPVKLAMPQFAAVPEPEPSKPDTEVQSQMKGQMVLDGVLMDYKRHVREIIAWVLEEGDGPQPDDTIDALTGGWCIRRSKSR